MILIKLYANQKMGLSIVSAMSFQVNWFDQKLYPQRSGSFGNIVFCLCSKFSIVTSEMLGGCFYSFFGILSIVFFPVHIWYQWDLDR